MFSWRVSCIGRPSSRALWRRAPTIAVRRAGAGLPLSHPRPGLRPSLRIPSGASRLLAATPPARPTVTGNPSLIPDRNSSSVTSRDSSSTSARTAGWPTKSNGLCQQSANPRNPRLLPRAIRPPLGQLHGLPPPLHPRIPHRFRPSRLERAFRLPLRGKLIQPRPESHRQSRQAGSS